MRRKRQPPCTCYAIHVAETERHAAELAGEIARWPEPIDVMRAAMGLPERWQLRAGRAWRDMLAAVSPSIPYTHLAFSVGAMWSSVLDAAVGPPVCARHPR